MLNKVKTLLKLIKLVKNMIIPMMIAVLVGTIGFLSAISISIFGSLGILKLAGQSINLNYELIIILLLVSGFMRGILRYIEQYFNHFIAFKILSIFRYKIFEKLRELSFTKIDNENKGSLISLITADIETLEVFYAHTISPFFIYLFTNAIIITLIFIYLPYLIGIIYIAIQILIGIILPYIYYKLIKNKGNSYRESFNDFNDYYYDSVYGINEIVLNNYEKNRLDNINERSNSLANKNEKLKLQTFKNQILADFIILFLTLLTCLILSLSLLNDSKNIILGTVVIISSFGPALALAMLPSFLSQTFSSAKRVINLLEEKPLTKNIINKNDFSFEKLEVSNLSFKYDKELVLSNINFEINKNEIVGIKGDSGIGKSTLLKLLLRFYDNFTGSIKYNSIDINEINTDSLKNNVILFSQNTYIFNKTIKENLIISNSNATDDEIIEACKKASIHDFIMNLENKYDTKLDMQGLNISTGEKQRLGLARVFLSKANLILLDEPTSNIDAINEGIILNAIKNNKQNKTFLIVSHRDSTLSICDKKYVLESEGIKNGK